MERNILYREAGEEDLNSISKLVLEVFNEFVGPGYSQEGQSVFQSYVQPEAIFKRISTGFSFIFIAVNNEQIVGVIEVKNGNHISVLFVDRQYHKLGIAKRLVSLAIKRATETNQVVEVTVNSSPYAVDIYKKLGFIQLDDEIERDGIRHIPMRKDLRS